MPARDCTDPRCTHEPGYVIECGYNLELGLASVGPGWAALVREGFAAVEGHGRVVQVKQKLGELRVYADLDGPDTSGIRDRLDALSDASHRVCSTCGGPRTPGDRLGRCAACAASAARRQ